MSEITAMVHFSPDVFDEPPVFELLLVVFVLFQVASLFLLDVLHSLGGSSR